MDFIQAARLKHFILKNFSVVLHIHDTCGGMYLSIEEPNEVVKEFILAFCRELSIPVTVSEDGRFFYPAKEGSEEMKADDKSRQQDTEVSGKENVRPLDESVKIQFEADRSRAAAYKDGREVGTCTYTETEDRWTVNHTWVDSSFRNQGIADRLMETVSREAKRRKMRLIPVCSYAVRWMEVHK